jgi:hypothetical protein
MQLAAPPLVLSSKQRERERERERESDNCAKELNGIIIAGEMEHHACLARFVI